MYREELPMGGMLPHGTLPDRASGRSPVWEDGAVDLQDKGLGKAFDPGMPLLSDIEFSIPKGQAVALIDAVLMGPDENQKFRGMAFIPAVADSDYNYVRKMYATIGQPQYAEFVGD